MLNRVVSLFHKLMEREIVRLTANLASGSPKTFDEYRYVCGQISALQIASKFLAQAIKEAEAENGG